MTKTIKKHRYKNNNFIKFGQYYEYSGDEALTLRGMSYLPLFDIKNSGMIKDTIHKDIINSSKIIDYIHKDDIVKIHRCCSPILLPYDSNDTIPVIFCNVGLVTSNTDSDTVKKNGCIYLRSPHLGNAIKSKNISPGTDEYLEEFNKILSSWFPTPQKTITKKFKRQATSEFQTCYYPNGKKEVIYIPNISSPEERILYDFSSITSDSFIKAASELKSMIEKAIAEAK